MTRLLSTIFPELSHPKKSVHFVGIGGIGMSALARWFLAQRANPERGRRIGILYKKAPKWVVSGSDLVKSPITDALAKEGVRVKIGHKKGDLPPQTGLVMYTKAANARNPELVEARRRKIPVLLYSEAVGRLTNFYKTVAIAGAHGKSTTTAMIGLLLQKAGLDPTVIVGTNLKEFGGKNFRAGKSNWLVLEADEFGKSFLDYSPTITVVTNIDLEHLDTYKNLAGVKNTFLKFISQTKNGCVVVLNEDSKNLLSLKNKISSIAKNKKLKVIWYSLKNLAAGKIKKIIKIPGEHNVSNALAALAVGKLLKISGGKTLSTTASYHGSWRRFEYRGTCRMSHVACRIYDDYAHHPTEIKATLKAFKEKYPRSPVVCVYQPHQAKRLQILWRDFINSFKDADILVLIPMYQVAGRDSDKRHATRDKRSSRALADAIKKKYPQKQVFYLFNPKNVLKFIAELLKPKTYNLKPIIVMMGAGDIVNYTPLLLK